LVWGSQARAMQKKGRCRTILASISFYDSGEAIVADA